MASAVGAVYGILGLDSAQFVKGLDQARNSANSSVGKINSAFAGINKGAMQLKGAIGSISGAFLGMNALIAGIAGGGLLVLTKQSMDFADKLHDTSIQVGLTTKGLQEFHYAAQLAGQTTEDFDASMGIFYKNVGQLKLGIGSLASFLQTYDTQVLENVKNTQSQEDALRVVADAVKNAKNETDRAAIATAAFGRSGLSMIQVLQDGSAGLDTMAQKANALGLVISDDLINKAGEANDKLDTLRMVIGAQLTNAVVQLAPLIGDLAQRFSDGLPVLIQYVDKFAQFMGVIGKDNAGKLADVNKEIANLNSLLGKNETLQKTLSFGGLLGDFDHDHMQTKLDALRKERDAIIAQMQAASSGTSSGTTKPTVYKPTVNTQTTNTRIQQGKELAKVTREHNTAIQKQVELNEDLGQTITANDEASQKWEDTMRDVGDQVSNSFTNAIFSGQKLGDVLRSLAMDIARIAFQRAAGDSVSSGISGLLKGAFSYFSGGAGGGAATPVASGGGTAVAHTGGIIGQTSLPRRYHTGGTVGKPALRPGEEMIIAQQGEMVLTKDQQASLAGGGGPPIILHIDARGADAGVEARIKASIPMAVQAAMRSYDDAKRRNPTGLR